MVRLLLWSWYASDLLPELHTWRLTEEKIGCSVTELVFCTLTFWDKTGLQYRQSTRQEKGVQGIGMQDGIKHKITWLAALFLWKYVGAECRKFATTPSYHNGLPRSSVALGGWIVTFMLRVRSGHSFRCWNQCHRLWPGTMVGRALPG